MEIAETWLADDRYTTWDGKNMINGIESIVEVAMALYLGIEEEVNST